jgi:hypothetical protein
MLDLGALYALTGLASAVLVWRRNHADTSRRLASSAVALLLWPIWVPIALAPEAPRRPRAAGRIARIETELDHAVEAARGSPFAILLPAEAAERIRREIRLAAARIEELDAVLAQPGFDRAIADRRVDELSAQGHARALRTAVLHRDNVARLETLRERHALALEELGELVSALRSQLVLSRYAGCAPEGVGGIVTELWARVEGLGEAMEAGRSGATT